MSKLLSIARQIEFRCPQGPLEPKLYRINISGEQIQELREAIAEAKPATEALRACTSILVGLRAGAPLDTIKASADVAIAQAEQVLKGGQ